MKPKSIPGYGEIGGSRHQAWFWFYVHVVTGYTELTLAWPPPGAAAAAVKTEAGIGCWCCVSGEYRNQGPVRAHRSIPRNIDHP